MSKQSGPSSTTRDALKTDVSALSFGSTLNTFRTERKLSQTALASQISHSAAFISLLETGKRRPTSELTEKIATALGFGQDSEERTALRRSAGFESSDISSVTQRIVDILGQRFQLDEAQRWMFHTDLRESLEGWTAVFTARDKFNQGYFIEVADTCESLLARHQWSPALKVNLLMLEAAAVSHLGDSLTAEQDAKEAEGMIGHGEVEPVAAVVAPEVKGLRGMIAADRGNFDEGEDFIRQSILHYQKLTAPRKPSDEPGRRPADDIAFLGLGASYKRLADIMLLRGDPEQAFSYTLVAQSYLMRANESPERDHWLRRVAEQQAWGYTKTHEFDAAIALRGKTRQSLAAAHDKYGLIRNSLFTGNDFLSRFKFTIRGKFVRRDSGASTTSEARSVEPASLAERSQITRDALRDEEIRRTLENAEQHYRDALEDLGDRGPQTMLGLCRRNLAVTLRYRLLHMEDTQESAEKIQETREDAQKQLAFALTIEKRIGNAQRIAAVYETMAQLESDQRHFTIAYAYYRKGIEELDSVLLVPPDPTIKRQRDKLFSAANEVAERIEVVGVDQSGAFPIGMVTPANDWQTLCNQLVEITRNLIMSTGSKPTCYSERADEWVEAIKNLESQSGGRRVLQNELADGLTDRMLPNLTLEGAKIHAQRFAMIKQAVQDARTPAQQNRDFCCRSDVEKRLRSVDGTAGVTRAQIETAIEWLEKYPNGFWLESADEAVPLGFFVKGSHILIEIPELLTRGLPDIDASRVKDSPLCYEIDCAEGADRLRAMFDEFVNAADEQRNQHGPQNKDTTLEWLKKLRDSQMATVGPHSTSGK